MKNEQQDSSEDRTEQGTAEIETDETQAAVSEETSVAEELAHNANLDNIILSVLFAAEEPVSIRKLTSIVGDTTGDEVRNVLDAWRDRFDKEAWSIRLEQVAGGYQLATRPDYAPYVSRLYSGRRKFRLSKAGMEVLAIVAYKQPITRAEVENVRGVGCGGVITNLMERSLVKITGKARVLGAPFLYGTTEEFLEYLGLNALRDLPSLEELERLLEKEAYPEDSVEAAEAAEVEGEEGIEETRPDREAVSDFSEALEALEAVRHAAIEETAKETPPAAASVATADEEAFAHTAALEEDDDAEGTINQIPTIEFDQEGDADTDETPEPTDEDEPRE